MTRCFKTIAALVLGAFSLSAANTTVTDNLNTIFGAVLGGNISSVRISAPAFVAADGTHVAAFSTNISITGGAFTYSFTPSIGSNPFGAYTLTMTGPSALRSFSLGVPVAADPTPLTFSQCQITSPWLSWGLGLGPSISGGGSGGGGGNGNATSINGLVLSSTLPVDGQGWLFNSTTNKLEPYSIPYWRKTSIPYTALTSIQATSGTITMFARGARQKVCGIAMYISPSFQAPGLSAINVTVGDSNGTSNLYTPIPASLLDNANRDYNVFGSATGYGNLTASFLSAGAQLSALTAGSVDIDVCLVSTP